MKRGDRLESGVCRVGGMKPQGREYAICRKFPEVVHLPLILIIRRSLRRWGVIAAVALLVGLLLVAGLAPRVEGVFGRLEREVPIYAVDTTEKKLAISFDAAWGADYTRELLRILKEHRVKTTFFLTGIWVEKYPEMVREIAAQGHEIGNHTTTHPHCASLSREQLTRELTDNDRMIRRLTGKGTRLFRPPFGEYNNEVLRTARSLGYEVIQWSVDSLDWQEVGTEAVVDRVLKNVQPGAIVLFHNNAKYTSQALPIILESLQKQGYRLVPISELLIKGDYYIEPHSGIQKPKKTGRN